MTRAIWGALRQDRCFQLALLVMALLALPYVTPGLPRESLAQYAFPYTNIAVISLGILALQYRLAHVPDAERRFWQLWTAALVLWLAQDVVRVDAASAAPRRALAEDALVVGFYVCLATAIHLRPDLGPAARRGVPWRIEVATTGVFALGLFVYFSLIPYLLERPLGPAVPSRVLYVALDSLIVLKLTWAALGAHGSRWRGLYACLLAASALWLLTGALELLMLVEIVPYRASGHISDLAWWLPFVPLIAAARLRELPFAAALGATPEPATPPGEGLWGDPLVAYAAAFPLMHFVLYGVGALDPVTRPAREAFALVALALIAGLTVAYQKLLLSENRRLAELRLRTAQAEHRAYHDALTGLPNRYLLFDRLEQALRRARRDGKLLALLFLDLDRFKVVNDSLGHSIGDRLLCEVAERLARHLRKVDTLARLGGDEFTIVLESIQTAEDAVKVAFKLREALRAPISLEGRELYVSGSIGIALFPEDGHDPEALLKSSDVAMYRAKEQGGDNHQLYRPEMNALAQERLTLESELRKAVGSDQFALQYQPVVELASGRVVGFEALLRWRHPQRGLLLPGHFIELAELTGVIVELGPWILGNACRQARGWNARGGDYVLAVNLSPRQFLDRDLPRRVERVLVETGLDPARLELEVTESLAMQNSELTATTLHALRAIGLRLAIDDFGTGYSSLSYLRQFPLDTLKLDRSFVNGIDRDPNAKTIAATILAMGRTLGLRVVAEGVENAAQLAVLQELGCACAQGYLFGRPEWPDQLTLQAAPVPGE